MYSTWQVGLASTAETPPARIDAWVRALGAELPVLFVTLWATPLGCTAIVLTAADATRSSLLSQLQALVAGHGVLANVLGPITMISVLRPPTDMEVTRPPVVLLVHCASEHRSQEALLDAIADAGVVAPTAFYWGDPRNAQLAYHHPWQAARALAARLAPFILEAAPDTDLLHPDFAEQCADARSPVRPVFAAALGHTQ